ncbi:hypothetical protein CLOM_g6369 [Closterium sp. NIES-68]|nr:hypothetical protein CLOM_g6369 [Closterium sp. NIES-68]GJP68855.1 hypothetical protein CLOP_g25504 [Closterium sp. NIES-67]
MAKAMSRWGLDKLLSSRGSDKLVSLLLPDGSMEMFGGGKTVADIMAEYPGHHVGSITSSRPCLAPQKSLHPGSTYYLEPTKQSRLEGAKSLPSKDFKGYLDGDRNNNGPSRHQRARKETTRVDQNEDDDDFLTQNRQTAGFIPRRMSLDAGALFSRQASTDAGAAAAAALASSSRHRDVFDATSDDDEDDEEMISPYPGANSAASGRSRRASVSDARSARVAAASLAEARQLWEDEMTRRQAHPARHERQDPFADRQSGYDSDRGYYGNESSGMDYGYNAGPANGLQSPHPQFERQPSCCRSCGGCGGDGGSMRSSRAPSPSPRAPPLVRSASAAAFPDFEGGDIAPGGDYAAVSTEFAIGGRVGPRAVHRSSSAQERAARSAFPDYDASAAAAACGLVPSPSPPPPGLAQWQQQQHAFSRSATYSRNDPRGSAENIPLDPRPAHARFPSAPSTPARRTSLDHRAMRASRPDPADVATVVGSSRGSLEVRSPVFAAVDSDGESQWDDGEIADEDGSVKSGYSLPSPHDVAAAKERRREREKREWMMMQRQMQQQQQQHMQQQHMQQQHLQQQQQMQHYQMQQFHQQHFQQQGRQQMVHQQRASSPRLHQQHHLHQQQQQPRLSRRTANSASGRSAGLPPRAVSPLPPLPSSHVSPPASGDFVCSPGGMGASHDRSETMRDGALIKSDSRSRSFTSLVTCSEESMAAQQMSGMSSWGSFPSLDSLSPEGSSQATVSPSHQF